jgi:hypothetical protein
MAYTPRRLQADVIRVCQVILNHGSISIIATTKTATRTSALTLRLMRSICAVIRVRIGAGHLAPR